MCSKTFHARFKSKGKKQLIPELYPVDDEGAPNPNLATVTDPQDLSYCTVTNASKFYEKLMSHREMDEPLAQEIFGHFEELPSSERVSTYIKPRVGHRSSTVGGVSTPLKYSK